MSLCNVHGSVNSALRISIDKIKKHNVSEDLSEAASLIDNLYFGRITTSQFFRERFAKKRNAAAEELLESIDFIFNDPNASVDTKISKIIKATFLAGMDASETARTKQE